jgi:hypothetical protein
MVRLRYFYAEATEVLTSGFMHPPRVETVMESLKYKILDTTPTCRMKWLPHGPLTSGGTLETGLDTVMTDRTFPASAETEILYENC